MIYRNVELHNVEEVISVEGGGVLLQRVPESVRQKLNEGAQMRMRQPDNAEIRFVGDGPVRITVSSQGTTRVSLFHGVFDGRERHVVGREPTTIEVRPHARLEQLEESYWRELPFAPRVFRLILGGPQREPLILHGVEGEGVRPPKADELPEIRYLAYGTSITHGFDAEGPHLTYVGQTAWHLGADLINLGVGGSAHCEPELADYMADRKDWDIASLALSVNMQGFALDEFYRRVAHMVNAVAGKNPGKPVACITLYPYFRDFGISDAGAEYGGTPEEFRQALREAAAACPHGNAHLIEGPDILTDMAGLTADLIHPGDHAMILMGRNLGERLKGLLGKG